MTGQQAADGPSGGAQSSKGGAPEPVLGVAHSLKGQGWRLRAFEPRIAEAVAQAHGLPQVAGQMLAARGVTPESAPAFLDPSLKQDMPDPSILMDMDSGAEALAHAVVNRRRIAIFGDYDVDGATSTAVLVRTLRALGVDPLVYIPDRMTEGYGPNAPAFDRLKADGAELVITVDCGILAFEPLAHAAAIGLNVIVVDHHKAETRLPEALAVINPNRLDDTSGLGQLAAVGVSFLLAVALLRRLRALGGVPGHSLPDLRGVLDVVALGTVCDVVPLTGLNRTFVAQGLKVMARRENAGLAALGDVAGLSEAPDAYHLGFLLGPRLNAGGRVGRSDLGAQLLTTEDPATARRLAEELDRLNAERRALESETLAAAENGVERRIGPAGSPPPVVVAAGEGWHPGVIGIVASRLTDRYHRPSVVIALDSTGEGKGSARSLPGVDMGAAVIEAVQRNLLIKGGGHAMAAGLTVAGDKIAEFEGFLNDFLGGNVAEASASRSLSVDGVIAAGGATPELVADIARVGPFGVGNPGPRFALPDMAVIKADRVGENHVRLIVKGRDGISLKAIAFREADSTLGNALLQGIGGRFHLAGKLKLDMWTGSPRVELILDDAARA
ncbi:single-stranded-DNA-specific exonuclease RecJ [Yunchengibacter salinarum]|uniref:single-stranded-DNA-specific exonuclease RecJ n=1 Tax=Yunchengibacter salinarum TaxID=3133399 RepID=UPI0035B68F10